MRVHLKTLGCRLNEAELETWASDFGSQGHIITQNEKDADVLVVNTCAVTQGAVRKSRHLIRKTQKSNPTAKLVISGCYATLNNEEATALDGVDLLVNNTQKDELVKLTLDNLVEETMPNESTSPGEVALFSRGRQRAFIKVQDGCRYRCTFCIVTIARGSEKSKSIEDIINEVNHSHAAGINEVIITGVHLGGYGSDINSNLYELIKTLLDKTTVPRIRMGSLEPWDLPDNFFDLFTNPRLMPHMHLPIQSGSDSVLRRMARRCKTSEFRTLVTKAKKIIPDINITTDIIVGFPGESEDEWQETISFVKEMAFSHIHIFSYSKREGTKAANLPNQVHNDVKKERSKMLHQLAEHSKLACTQRLIGQEAAILWEEKKSTDPHTNTFVGYTPNYIRVSVTTDNAVELTNRVTVNKIAGIHNGVPFVELTPN